MFGILCYVSVCSAPVSNKFRTRFRVEPITSTRVLANFSLMVDSQVCGLLESSDFYISDGVLQ